MEKARKEGEGIGLAKFLKSTELKEMVKFALQEGSTDLKNSPEKRNFKKLTELEALGLSQQCPHFHLRLSG
ncbi:hypothetical protein CDL15_Pgr016765 [Punica granatum]|uniref:Uncharacterized protein n=1 Tax=Punica granatum TaxID=22663 RepID=A0A218WXR8_PUNGR|nr:hypothetical protein CDL15_Pgr016765 [Punica granatum]